MSDSHSPASPADHPAAGSDVHPHDDEHHDFWSHCTLYFWVGGILFLFTAITVFLAYVNFAEIGLFRALFNFFGIHGNQINIVIGMIVATFKVTLVAAIFMHLKGEVKTVWRPLWFTLFFVAGLFLLTIFAFFDPIFSSLHYNH
jgi:hypothetical protein